MRKKESELSTKCSQLKLKAQDEKLRETDTLDTQRMLKLIESISSPKAEPFKMWLANLGSERIDEVFHPEIAIKRAVDYYRKRGYPDKCIIAEGDTPLTSQHAGYSDDEIYIPLIIIDKTKND